LSRSEHEIFASAPPLPDSRPSACPAQTAGARGGWALERVLFAIAGTVVLAAAALSAFVSPWFLLLVAFVGVNQWLYVLVGDCPMSLILTRVFGVRRGVTR
jgi:hypothetical protein